MKLIIPTIVLLGFLYGIVKCIYKFFRKLDEMGKDILTIKDNHLHHIGIKLDSMEKKIDNNTNEICTIKGFMESGR